MQRILTVLAGFLRAIFGSWNWQPPAWTGKLRSRFYGSRFFSFIKPVLEKMRNRVAADPERFRKGSLAVLSAIVILSAGGFALKRYYDSLPKPEYAKVAIRAPHAKKIGEEKITPLVIEFSESIAPVKELNKPLLQGPEISPPVRGIWHWASDRILQFTPEETAEGDWGIGGEYHLKLSRQLLAAHVLLEEYSFDFTTESFTATLSKPEFYIDPKDAKIKKVTAQIDFNYPVRTEDLKKKVHFRLEDKDAFKLKRVGDAVPAHVTFNKTFETAYLESDVLAVPEHAQVMAIEVEEDLKPLRAKGNPSKGVLTGDAEVPGRYDGFAVSNFGIIYPRNDKFEPEQVIKVDSSLSAESDELAKNLKILLLPADHQPAGANSVIRNYAWNSPAEVTKEVVAKAQNVEFTTIPTENPVSTIHSFRIHVPTDRYVLVSVAKNTRAWGDYLLKSEATQVVNVPQYPQELSFMGDGSILSLGGDNQLPLLSRNLREVKFEIGRVLPDQVNHVLISMLNSSFKTPSIYQDFEYAITERWEQKQKLELNSSTATQYFALNLEPYLRKGESKRGLFFVKATAEGVSQISRLVLVTDLGAIAKHSNSGKTEVFAQNFRTGLPLSDALVEIIGKNGISVLDARTGPQGQVTFLDLKDYKNEKQPTAIVIKKGGDVSYLPFLAGDREVNYSRFDVGGSVESSESDQLQAMMFSDRGMYRPGETANLGMIVRAKNWKKGKGKIPVTWTVTDPRGNELKREKLEISSADLKALSFSTQAASPTGTYSAQVFVIQKNQPDQQIGSTTVQVQEFMPDHLRISAALSKEKPAGWIAPELLEGNVSLHNMFGTAAEDRRLEGKITLTPVAPSVKGFPDYIFANPNKRDAQTFSENLPNAKTDDKGHGKFDIDLSKYEGFFYLRFEAQGFEAEAGKGVLAATGTYVSNLPYLVGYKPESELTYLKRSSSASVRLQAIDSSDKKLPVGKVKLSLVEHRFVSVLTKQDNSNYKYQSVRKDIALGDSVANLPAEGMAYPLVTDKPGDFTVILKTADGRELNHFDYSVIAEANLSRSLEKNSELQVALNKKDFKPGEEIEMQIRAPYAGAGLITIERDEVYAVHWFKTTSNSTVERIHVPEGLEGNAYVNVTMLRSIDSKEIFTSPLSAAVAPFSISLDQFKAKVNLQVPERVKPGQELKVRYSADRRTPIIVYGVDEGILQVSGYKLPNPLAFFFQKRALQVHTYQLLDLLLPDFSVLKSLSAAGGDEGGANGSNLNPFRRKGQPPVAFWSGVIEAEPKTKTFTYQVPDYFNGNIRVMAVSAAQSGLGAQATDGLVRGDLIITPSAPTFAAPGDEFQLGLSVSNQSDVSIVSDEVKVEIETSPQLAVPEKTQTLKILKGHEAGLHFTMKATDKLGDGKMVIKASVGKASARYAVDLSVRPAVPQVTTIASGELTALPKDLKFDRALYPEFARQQLTLGSVPLAQAFGLAQFLKSYPYDCTEQLVSKGFPQLVLADRPEFEFSKRAGTSYQETIDVLRTRQTANGGFALYGANAQNEDAAASLYALHFLTEVKDHSHPVPEQMLERALGYAASETIRQAETLPQARLFAYAVYLQARNGIVPTRDIGFLRESLDKNFPDQWKTDTTAIFLAGAYKLLKQDEAADKLIRKLKPGENEVADYENYLDPLVHDSLLIYVTARHFPALLKEKVGFESLKKMTKPLEGGQFNTHSAAHLLLAFDAIMASTENGLLNVTAEERSEGKVRMLNVPKVPLARLALGAGAQSVSLGGTAGGPLFYSMLQSGFDRAGFPEIKKRMEILRTYTDESGSKVTKAKLGQELTVHLLSRALDKATFSNVVLVDLLPAGFEVVLDSHPKGNGSGGDTEAGDEPAPEEPAVDPNGGGDGEGDGAGERAWIPSLVPRAFADEAPASALAPFYAQYVDYREDRIIAYGGLSDEVHEFTYKIKAVNQGRFTVPPPFGESMYDRSVQYRGVISEIEVVAP